jgi:hypothetical protein
MTTKALKRLADKMYVSRMVATQDAERAAAVEARLRLGGELAEAVLDDSAPMPTPSHWSAIVILARQLKGTKPTE